MFYNLSCYMCFYMRLLQQRYLFISSYFVISRQCILKRSICSSKREVCHFHHFTSRGRSDLIVTLDMNDHFSHLCVFQSICKAQP